MPDQTKIAIRSTTQDHLDIEDVRDGIVILKDGGSCIVLSVTAINFGLLSEKEQEATIYAYAALLNSLNYPIQIVIRSQRKDVSAYLKLLEEVEIKEGRKLIKGQIQKYRQFIQDTVQKNNVLDKKFYLVIPMSSLEVGVAQSLSKSIGHKKGLPFDKNYILEKAKVNLYPKRDHLLRQLNRLGLKGRQLDTAELIKIYFDIYNPESYGQQIAPNNQYQVPIVQSTTPPIILPPLQTQEPSPAPQAQRDPARLDTTPQSPTTLPLSPLSSLSPQLPSHPPTPPPTKDSALQDNSSSALQDKPGSALQNDLSVQDQINSLIKESVK